VKFLLLLLLAESAAAQVELLREEAYNYRIVGALPKAWKRQGVRRSYSFFIDAIPHAHVQFARQRIRGEPDLAKELAKRAVHYRFPETPKETKGTIRKTRWGGRDAWLYQITGMVRGVACTRRVTALLEQGVFYELIETVYGDKTAALDRCRRGLEVFRTGFSLLTNPLPDGATTDPAETRLTDARYGYTIVKPRGFLRLAVDPAADPGVREHFERVNDRQHARVRLFEFPARESLRPPRWFDVFYSGFRANHDQATRADETPPAVPGSRSVWVQRFEGTRDGLAIRTRVYLVHAQNGRVFVLRVRTQDGADTLFAKGLKQALDSFRAG